MPRAECSSTKNSLSSSTSCVHTRYGWKGATLRRTPIVIRTRNDACGADIDGVVDDVAARRLPRNKSGDGVALRGGVGDAGAKGERSSMVPHPHCDRPCFGHRRRGAGCLSARHDAAARSHPLFRRCDPDWAWNLLLGAASAPSLGSYASWLSRFDHLVVSYGLCARRRP